MQADMYQQNLIQLNKSKESIGETNVSRLKTPAYDPFVAANKLLAIVGELMQPKYNIEFIHVFPLSTKQIAYETDRNSICLGLFGQTRCPIDIICPPADTYLSEGAIGIKRTWRYGMEV